MKICCLGYRSFIASHLPDNWDKIPDRLNPDFFSIGAMINQYKPDVLINCIGYCGATNIDDCEKNKAQTFTANTLIPIMLAQECQARNIRLIQISSGCIFNRTSPHCEYQGDLLDPFSAKTLVDLGWTETDPANPVSTYGYSKYAADLVLESFPLTTILRIRMPLSWKHHPRNLISKLLNYKRVVQEKNSISALTDVSRAVMFAIDHNLSGIYNCTNTEPVLHADILDEYAKYHPEHTYEKISASELDRMTVAKRTNCILNNQKLRDAGFEFTPTKEAIQYCVKEYVKNV